MQPMQPDLYPLPLPARRRIFLPSDILLEANRESIRLGFNHCLDESKLLDRVGESTFMSIIRLAMRHVGWNGADFDNENIRLLISVPFMGDPPDTHLMLLLDITHDMWQNILENQPSDEDPGGVLEDNGL